MDSKELDMKMDEMDLAHKEREKQVQGKQSPLFEIVAVSRRCNYYDMRNRMIGNIVRFDNDSEHLQEWRGPWYTGPLVRVAKHSFSFQRMYTLGVRLRRLTIAEHAEIDPEMQHLELCK